MFSDNGHIFNDDNWIYYDFLKKSLSSASDSELINDFLFFKVISESTDKYDNFVSNGKGHFLSEFEISFDNYVNTLCYEMAMRFYKNYLITHQEDNKNEE